MAACGRAEAPRAQSGAAVSRRPRPFGRPRPRAGRTSRSPRGHGRRRDRGRGGIGPRDPGGGPAARSPAGHGGDAAFSDGGGVDRSARGDRDPAALRRDGRSRPCLDEHRNPGDAGLQPFGDGRAADPRLAPSPAQPPGPAVDTGTLRRSGAEGAGRSLERRRAGHGHDSPGRREAAGRPAPGSRGGGRALEPVRLGRGGRRRGAVLSRRRARGTGPRRARCLGTRGFGEALRRNLFARGGESVRSGTPASPRRRRSRRGARFREGRRRRPVIRCGAGTARRDVPEPGAPGPGGRCGQPRARQGRLERDAPRIPGAGAGRPPRGQASGRREAFPGTPVAVSVRRRASPGSRGRAVGAGPQLGRGHDPPEGGPARSRRRARVVSAGEELDPRGRPGEGRERLPGARARAPHPPRQRKGEGGRLERDGGRTPAAGRVSASPRVVHRGVQQSRCQGDRRPTAVLLRPCGTGLW